MSTGERTAPADTARLRAAPRCGARTRAGTSCRSPAVHGRPRCRMHGCGGGKLRRSGAPRGNRNAWKDGFYTAAARARRRDVVAFIRRMEASLAEIAAMARAPAPAFGEPSSGAWGCSSFFRAGSHSGSASGSPPGVLPGFFAGAAPPPSPGARRAGRRAGAGRREGDGGRAETLDIAVNIDNLVI